jgi:leucyl-tRNA synthetase
MAEYKPQEIEKKWQKYWEENRIFQTDYNHILKDSKLEKQEEKEILKN